jgi:ketosteroid isomerase-like protein
MSEENVAVVRQALESFNEGGADAAAVFYDPAVVLDNSRSPFPDSGLYRGLESVRGWFDGLADAFGDISYEIEAIRDLGDRVAVLLRVRGRGPHSGIDVDYRFAPLITVRNGKIVRIDRFTDLEEALETAGLTEQGPGWA